LRLAEPRGDRRADYHAALITKAIYDFMLGFSKSRRKVRLSDLLIKFERRETNPAAVARKASAFFGNVIPEEDILRFEEKQKAG